MAVQNGTLVKNRRRLTLQPGNNDVDTGLRMQRQAFAPDPGLNGVFTVTPSRVMVMPMAPTVEWNTISVAEPFLDPVTGTVHVIFNNSDVYPHTINVLFDAVHTLEAPVSADTYNPPL